MKTFIKLVVCSFLMFVAVLGLVIQSAYAEVTLESSLNGFCLDKQDGNYPLPWDCTRFISCSGGIASERDCASCNVDPIRCPEGRTVYNFDVDKCLWADETECKITDSLSNSFFYNSSKNAGTWNTSVTAIRSN